jgi:hypothetical protein
MNLSTSVITLLTAGYAKNALINSVKNVTPMFSTKQKLTAAYVVILSTSHV